MQTKITFRHLKSRQDLQEAALDAIKKFERFSDLISSASVEFTADSKNKVQFTLVVNGDTLIVEESSEDFLKSLRGATDKMVRQLKKHKAKLIERN
ncbi:MAG: hypothetical protein CH6_2819 [Candidatus Kapaibacterium sp.]|jgi:putative sigma-54 modulation protein|nr:MAG: hypothetical protein CH6_2819 [Candidatus Kapabacteria bacterium]ROL57011.1 MAG: ribosome-associated translation inhibitor RaiA [Bacteroidetes/Chlorobi group bacterium Naka2016]